DGQVVAGCVCNPAADEVFHAVRGDGAFLGERRLRGPRRVALDRAVVGTGFAYDRARRARQAAVVAALLPRVADIRRAGAASLDLVALAAGRIDAYYEVGLHPWDWAAGVLIAQEAGCVLTGPAGGAPGPELTAGAGPELAGEFFRLLDELAATHV
ncbi:MAG: inositol monophosphatase, partial [Actinomycetia bacterium]|nr:inositol monophosphatase [Actinomycetes bacterium]